VFDSPLTTPTLHSRTQSNPQGNSGHTETHDALRAKILEHLQGALTMTKKLFTLTGKNFTVDDHIPVLAANLYKTIIGQHPTPHTARLPDLRGPKVPHRRSQVNSGQNRPTTTTPEPISKPRPECKHPQPAPTIDNADIQVDQNIRANHFINRSCINYKSADIKDTNYLANWTCCLKCL